MTSVNFCYWLQGWFELNASIDHREGATPETLEIIRKHLAMVFKHEIDPSFPDEQQEALSTLHNSGYPSSTDTTLIRC